MKIAISLLILSCLCTSALAQVQSLQHKEAKRRYIVYTPPPSTTARCSKSFPSSSISMAAA